MSGRSHKQIVIPSKENHSVDIPERFFGKKIEVIMQEAGSSFKNDKPMPPPGKKRNVEELFENFGKGV